ncbi:sensor histidine kinase [Aerophototrophica crusticola]|uniref:histidine kinase n=1 Tax=Aerophototrophica crusticola TaxID=1709002 RepID=A0A858R5K7_9PROT|nr:sensor histidine kinase [Rhodospirillaceae bacterium B3]
MTPELASPQPAGEKLGFDISANVVRQLGDELVSDEVTALVELIKNSYDADASYVRVEISTDGRPDEHETYFPDAKGYIKIEDDGDGMGLADLRRGWLTISLSEKGKLKDLGVVTKRKKRTPLGEKGLGRLSTQKLGANLEIVTRKLGSEEVNHVGFSWDSFGTGTKLTEVEVRHKQPKIFKRPHGATLVISGLKNPAVWVGDDLVTLSNKLAQIVAPYEEIKPFSVTVTINNRPVDLAPLSREVRAAAVAVYSLRFSSGRIELDGRVRLAKFQANASDDVFFEKNVLSDSGRRFFDFLSHWKSKAPFVGYRYEGGRPDFLSFSYEVALASLKPSLAEDVSDSRGAKDVIVADPGPFRSEFAEYSLRNLGAGGMRDVSTLSDSTLRSLVKIHAGVKVFRDGFGVRPYGVDQNDWLKLGAAQTSGSSWYGLRPNNTLGYVLISEKHNRSLREKTDREGFIDNPYSRNFFKIHSHAVSVINQFHEWVRRGYLAFKAECLPTPVDLLDASAMTEFASAATGHLDRFSSSAAAVQAKVQPLQARVSALVEDIRQRPLLGMDPERLHALMADLETTLAQTRAALSDAASLRPQAEQLVALAQHVTPRIAMLQQRITDFSELASLGLIAEALTHEIENIADRVVSRAKGAMNKAQKAKPENVELRLYAMDVIASANALSRQVSHLSPSLRYKRDVTERFDIASFVADIKNYHDERWQASELVLHISSESENFELNANRGKLMQVFDNLIMNSEYWVRQNLATAGGTPGCIHVLYSPMMVQIWDSGTGVDPAVEDTLFEPFVTLKPRNEGRGLGLFICSQILESLGGTLVLLHRRNSFGRRYVFQMDLSGAAPEGMGKK